MRALLIAAVFGSCAIGWLACGSDDGDGPGNGAGGGCTSANCAGCCLNNVCQSGNTAAACGKNAAACMACTTNQVCRTDQTCGVDPESSWRVQPAGAQIAPNDNGTDWDADSSPPDVFVTMTCPPSIASSTAAVQSYSPSWTSGGCVTKAKNLLQASWTFQLWDEDLLSDDTITQVLSYQFKEQDFVAGAVTLSASGGMQSLTVQLQRQ
jgi:hypothetical protein